MSYDNKEKKTAKGICRAQIKKMRHEQYKQCLFAKSSTMASCNLIRSHNHQVYSEQVRKIALSPFDDKRHVLENGYTTLAHGHYRIQQ